VALLKGLDDVETKHTIEKDFLDCIYLVKSDVVQTIRKVSSVRAATPVPPGIRDSPPHVAGMAAASARSVHPATPPLGQVSSPRVNIPAGMAIPETVRASGLAAAQRFTRRALIRVRVMYLSHACKFKFTPTNVKLLVTEVSDPDKLGVITIQGAVILADLAGAPSPFVNIQKLFPGIAITGKVYIGTMCTLSVRSLNGFRDNEMKHDMVTEGQIKEIEQLIEKNAQSSSNARSSLIHRIGHPSGIPTGPKADRQAGIPRGPKAGHQVGIPVVSSFYLDSRVSWLFEFPGCSSLSSRKTFNIGSHRHLPEVIILMYWTVRPVTIHIY